MPARGGSLESHHRSTPKSECFLLAPVDFFSLAHLTTISKCGCYRLGAGSRDCAVLPEAVNSADIERRISFHAPGIESTGLISSQLVSSSFHS